MIIDWQVKQLVNFEIQDELVFELLPLYSSELQKNVSKFASVAVSGEKENAAKICHILRGSAAIYGFKDFARCLSELEDSIACGQIDPVQAIEPLQAVAGAIVDAIAQRQVC